ncbi:winged helix-turn-helix domain-containing protein [Anaerolentibacter hominis]|uniref:ArsR/SmtB family transcription factor n=1 Tax=Anaerolentibacter hominis TaxID=3079009 RepID=UPI0031B86DAD
MSNQLNPQVETLFLLWNCPWEDKEAIISELEKEGFSGREFYQRHLLPIETYYQIFSENMMSCSGADYLKELDIVALSVYAGMLTEHPDWLENFSGISDHEVSDCIEKMILSDLEEGYDDVFDYLEEAQELSEKAKWQLIVLQHRGKEVLSQILEAVKLNLPAYEKAAAAIENEINSLMEQFGQSLNASDKTGLMRLPGQLNPDAVIIPTLALPMAILVVSQIGFYGLLCSKLSPDSASEITKEELLVGAKALSEKSKLEILLCLKEKSRYSLEIAELVGLTPATVSHHMNSLLGAGFVEFERREGKVFYKLAEDAVKRFFTGGGRLLLR